jgi:hypothetical protein
LVKRLPLISSALATVVIIKQSDVKNILINFILSIIIEIKKIILLK